MKLHQLESILTRIQPFSSPKIEYEQYSTDAHLASRMLYMADTTFDDIQTHVIADLGCGGGIFLIGAILLGSGYGIGIDIDNDALDLATHNISQMEDYIGDSIDLVRCDVQDCGGFRNVVDVVFTNPPFGTKTVQGIDMVFLERGIEMARKAVYSFHKSSTREYIMKQAQKWPVNAQVLAETKFVIPQTYSFHRKHAVTIEVDLWRFEKVAGLDTSSSV